MVSWPTSDSHIRIWLWLWTCARGQQFDWGSSWPRWHVRGITAKMMTGSTKLLPRSTNSCSPRRAPRPNLSSASCPSSGARSSTRQAVSKGAPACSPRKPCDFQVVPKPVCKLGCSTEAAHTPSTRHIPISSRRLGCSHSRRITSLRILFSRCTEHLKLLAFRCFLRFSRSSLYWRCDGSYSYGHVAT
jgi:hypothetical protein